MSILLLKVTQFASYICVLNLLLLVSSSRVVLGFQPTKTSSNYKEIYQYFGFGSNVLPSTMKALRRINPINYTAAILPNYELKFDGSANNRIEPSAAFVVPSNNNKVVHGVLYTLSADDFAKVGNTEGVPFGYRWKRCRVYPYVGNGDNAGRLAMESSSSIEAFTLISPNANLESKKNVPPSSSYLGLIKEGAAVMKFDRDYQNFLSEIEEAMNLIIPQGISGLLLRGAEIVSGMKRN